MIFAVGLIAAQVAAPPELRVPAWSALSHPRPEGVVRDLAERVVDFDDELVFQVHCARTGQLALDFELAGRRWARRARSATTSSDSIAA